MIISALTVGAGRDSLRYIRTAERHPTKLLNDFMNGSVRGGDCFSGWMLRNLGTIGNSHSKKAMARKPKAFDIWKEMKPAGLRRLAMAVFLLFGVFGPLTVLMESNLHIVSWSFIIIQTIASGGMAASIILFGRN